MDLVRTSNLASTHPAVWQSSPDQPIRQASHHFRSGQTHGSKHGEQYFPCLWASSMYGALGWELEGDPDEGPSHQHSKGYYSLSFSWRPPTASFSGCLKCQTRKQVWSLLLSNVERNPSIQPLPRHGGAAGVRLKFSQTRFLACDFAGGKGPGPREIENLPSGTWTTGTPIYDSQGPCRSAEGCQ